MPIVLVTLLETKRELFDVDVQMIQCIKEAMSQVWAYLLQIIKDRSGIRFRFGLHDQRVAHGRRERRRSMESLRVEPLLSPLSRA